MSDTRPSPAPRRSPSRSIARAIVGWLESAAALAPGADRATAPDAALACCGAAAVGAPANRLRRADGWISK